MSPDLNAAAAAEVQRLTAARMLRRDGDELALMRLEADGPWIGIARSKLKRRLARRRLEIWRVGYQDPSGRLVESRLVALAIDEHERSPARLALPTATRVARRRAARVARGFQPSEIHAAIDAATIEWRDAAARAVASFASARLARETAIAASSARVRPAPFQTGLFDRREQQAHTVLEESRRTLSEALAERKGAVERAAAVVATAPELLLVIAGAGRA
jgi:hypothetical protein